MPTLTPFSSDLQDSKDGAAFADVKFSALNELLERLRTSEVFNPDYVAPVVEPVVEPVAEPVSCAALHFMNGGGGGPTPFLYMATRFLPNVHVQKCTKYVFSCMEVPWIDLLAVANLQ